MAHWEGKKKNTGQRDNSAARPPGNVPVLLMTSPRLRVSTGPNVIIQSKQSEQYCNTKKCNFHLFNVKKNLILINVMGKKRCIISFFFTALNYADFLCKCVQTGYFLILYYRNENESFALQ